MSFDQSKSPLESTTIRAGISDIIKSVFLAWLGISVDAATVEIMLVALWSLANGIITIYGRYKADTKIAPRR